LVMGVLGACGRERRAWPVTALLFLPGHGLMPLTKTRNSLRSLVCRSFS